MNVIVKDYLCRELRNSKNLNINEIYPYFEYIANYKTSIDTFSRVSETLIPKIEELSKSDSIKENRDLICLITGIFEPFIKKVSWIVYGDETEAELKDKSKVLSYYLDKMNIEFRIAKKTSDNYDNKFHYAYELRDTQAHTAKSWNFLELAKNLNNILYGFLYIIKVNISTLKDKINKDDLNKNIFDTIPIINWLNTSFLPEYDLYFDFIKPEHLPLKILCKVAGNCVRDYEYDLNGIEIKEKQKIIYQNNKPVQIIMEDIGRKYILHYDNGLLASADLEFENTTKELLRINRFNNGSLEIKTSVLKFEKETYLFNSKGKMIEYHYSGPGKYDIRYDYKNDILIGREVTLDEKFTNYEKAENKNNVISFYKDDKKTLELTYKDDLLIKIVGLTVDYEFIYNFKK